MSISVRIPTQLRSLTSGDSEVTTSGGSIGEVVASLEVSYPGIRERLLDDSGAIRRFVNLYLNDEDVRFLQGVETPVPDGATLSIIPAVAGGQLLVTDALPVSAGGM
ncbi:MAG: MoaD/ThiS family protein [Actinobacteria bacterium]|nr:MoaD/ThiS family protein [Actinomycetota bacterium]